MKNPFKKTEQTKAPVGSKENPEVLNIPPAPEIRTVVGYEINGTIYKTIENAEVAFMVPKLMKLTVSNRGTMYGNYFDSEKAAENFQAIRLLFTQPIPVRPLYTP